MAFSESTKEISDWHRRHTVNTRYSAKRKSIKREIDALCSYLDVLEDLIRDAEKKEMAELTERFPEDHDYWDYFYPAHWQDIFVKNFRQSFIINSVALLEYTQMSICRDAEMIGRFSLRVKDRLISDS